jgi:hypothetical protein
MRLLVYVICRRMPADRPVYRVAKPSFLTISARTPSGEPPPAIWRRTWGRRGAGASVNEGSLGRPPPGQSPDGHRLRRRSVQPRPCCRRPHLHNIHRLDDAGGGDASRTPVHKRLQRLPHPPTAALLGSSHGAPAKMSSAGAWRTAHCANVAQRCLSCSPSPGAMPATTSERFSVSLTCVVVDPVRAKDTVCSARCAVGHVTSDSQPRAPTSCSLARTPRPQVTRELTSRCACRCVTPAPMALLYPPSLGEPSPWVVLLGRQWPASSTRGTPHMRVRRIRTVTSLWATWGVGCADRASALPAQSKSTLCSLTRRPPACAGQVVWLGKEASGRGPADVQDVSRVDSGATGASLRRRPVPLPWVTTPHPHSLCCRSLPRCLLLHPRAGAAYQTRVHLHPRGGAAERAPQKLP